MGKAVGEEVPDGMGEAETLNFMYLQAVYSLNTFYGFRIRPAGCFETENERVCAEVIGKGGNIVDMRRAGADALYCALLSEPFVDKELLLKTVDRYIPF